MTELKDGAVQLQERIDAWKKKLLPLPLPVVWRFMYYVFALHASERYVPSVELADAMQTLAQLDQGELPELAAAYADLTEHYYGQFAMFLTHFDLDDRVIEDKLFSTLMIYRAEVAEAEGWDVPKVPN